jgi:predicted PurR-regulated permease PerM
VAGAVVLALLYFGRDVLIPITLALILSLAIAPLVRRLRRIGLGRVGAVLAASAALCVLLMGAMLLIGLQVYQIATSLPQYESTIEQKAHALRAATFGRMQLLEGEARKVTDRLVEKPAAREAVLPTDAAPLGAPGGVVPVEIRQPAAGGYELVRQVVSTAWVPLQTIGIVLVVLLFVLLEHDALRDRFIRLAGGTDLRGTTVAINDAGARLSRFFVSQFGVNFGVGAAVAAALAVIGLPHAALWGVLTGILRFVPYVGVIGAALCAALLAAAVDPGWTLMLLTLGVFALVELIASQLVEPQLYGHTTGLSPLAIVVATIFWSWLWGPVGLIVSTPLTLCLVVAGRHVKTLGFLDVLFGDSHALTMAERFYQRALSGDALEIIEAAHLFLRRKTFAAYCDDVLLRATRMAFLDAAAGAITHEEQVTVRRAVIQVVSALEKKPSRARRKRRPVGGVLDELNPGRELRLQREQVSGRLQGPMTVPPGSIVVCVGLGSLGDDFVTEILVRVLRDRSIDARHVSHDEYCGPMPEGMVPGSASMLCAVTVNRHRSSANLQAVIATARSRSADACIMVVSLAIPAADEGQLDAYAGADLTASSFVEAARQVEARLAKTVAGASPVQS